ncbi:hypothetical protein D0T49_01925 [Paludibacter sp. 221]|uniref:hypothetical protein n=1 Tax=Paludibacter sp. 221 TaxID=2302939 RepID=UPI0013D66E01|nr:hypothetical protein [Paludibacter sp. 221]NDV45808.1 hypothetical protein [Paludibacter sp. 221]
MKKFELDKIFEKSYLSALQTKIKLADTNTLIAELGRGSGKTTHIKAARIDRVQNSMPGALLTLGAATYRDIFSNILPGVMEYFNEHYERGIYFEVGKEPPRHFKKCTTPIFDWKHSFSFHNGSVIKFVSADRPESVLGISTPHGFFDELLKIKKEFMMERFMPTLRADRSKFGHSPYFMGWSGFTSTPNFETDEDWFIDLEKEMNREIIDLIIEIAYEIDFRLYELEIARKTLDFNKIKRLERFINRWTKELNELKRKQLLYIRASSFSNLKILGVDYIENQIKSTKDKDLLYTSIFAIRKLKVKDMFFGKFGKQHLFDDGYEYRYIDRLSAGDTIEDSCKHLRYYDKSKPLVAGYDPGPFSSMIFAQQNSNKKELRVLKNIWVWHPDQHAEFAKKIDDFFSGGKKVLYLYYDRAANQKDPEWKKYYPDYKEHGINDTDAKLIKQELQALGWTVHLLSPKQKTIYYSQHYRLLNILFRGRDKRIDKILIDKNECEALVSSINHSPLKRHEGRIILDKTSERLPFEEQAYNSTQLSSAFMYLLWGLYSKYLPDTDLGSEMPKGAGTYSS